MDTEYNNNSVPSQLLAFSPNFGVLCLPSSDLLLDDGNFLHILSPEPEESKQTIQLSIEEVTTQI